MPVILYRDKNFEGPAARLQPGFYSGRDELEGKVRGSSYGEDLDNEASSVRVDEGYVAVLFGGYSRSASGGGARTLVGPAEVADLGTIGMDDAVSSVQVLMYRPYASSDLGATPRDFGVKLYTSLRLGGTAVRLGQGDYSRGRLDSDEIKLPSSGAQSLCVAEGTIAILYAGNNFETNQNSVVVGPGTCVQDVDSIGMLDSATGKPAINSVRVLYAALDTPPGVSGPPSQLASAVQSMQATSGEGVTGRADVFLRSLASQESRAPNLPGPDAEGAPPKMADRTVVRVLKIQGPPRRVEEVTPGRERPLTFFLFYLVLIVLAVIAAGAAARRLRLWNSPKETVAK